MPSSGPVHQNRDLVGFQHLSRCAPKLLNDDRKLNLQLSHSAGAWALSIGWQPWTALRKMRGVII